MTALRLAAPARDGSSLRVTPGVDEVRAMVGRHGQVCLSHTFLADCETPVSALLKLRDGGPCFLLESAEQGQRLGRYSMLGVRPQAVIRAEGDRLTLRSADGGERDLDASDPFGAVGDVVEAAG